MVSCSLPHWVQTLARRLGPKPFAYRPLHPDLPEPTWQDLHRAAWTLARRLVADGMAVQEMVAIFAADDVEALVAEVAVQAAGGTAVIPPAGASPSVLAAMPELARIPRFLHDDRNAALVGDLARAFPDARPLRIAPLEAAAASPDEVPDPDPLDQRLGWLGPGSPAVVLFPGHRPDGRGVVWTQANLLGTGEALANRVQAAMDDAWLALGPLDHPFLRVASWYAAAATGGTLCLFPPDTPHFEMLWMARPSFVALRAADADAFAARIDQEVAALPGLPGRLARWGFSHGRERVGTPPEGAVDALRSRVAGTLCAGRLKDLTGGRLRGLLHGWGPPPDALVRNLGVLGTTVHESWGLPETAGCCTLSPARPGRPAWGAPLDGVTLGFEADGRIAVSGHCLYHTHSMGNALEAAWHRDGRLVTEVAGSLDPEGRLVLAEYAPA